VFLNFRIECLELLYGLGIGYHNNSFVCMCFSTTASCFMYAV